MEPHPFNKTLAYEDLREPGIAPTYRNLQRWVWGWFLRGHRLGVNGASRRRVRVRPQKMWEYSRGLALTKTSAPTRPDGAKYTMLDVGGAMTLPLFYFGDMGDKVVSLDIHPELSAETNRVAKRTKLDVAAHTTNLVEEDPSASDLGAEGGFDFAFCFCVIEHIVPPGQGRVAERMGKLLKPGGKMVITFDYGANASSEAPIPTIKEVHELRDTIGLPLIGNAEFHDDGRRYPISRRYPDKPFTFGSLFFQKPE